MGWSESARRAALSARTRKRLLNAFRDSLMVESKVRALKTGEDVHIGHSIHITKTPKGFSVNRPAFGKTNHPSVFAVQRRVDDILQEIALRHR